MNKDYTFPVSVLISALILGGAWVYTARLKAERASVPTADQGVEIPAEWGDLGRKMVEAGVFDRSQLSPMDGKLRITRANSGLLLDLLWALGLSNKNQILEKGPMMDPRYGGADKFASTGGWTLAKGGPMNHYSMHQFIMLTPEEQTLVETVAKNIYRPCCGNSTYFPDCNHGMAMLGLLELMASQGASEAEMYQAALAVNSYWFPDQYATITRYLESRGIAPQAIDPKEILGEDYSSAAGFERIASLVPRTETNQTGKGGCSL
jgi:hypothetical protein